MKGSICFRPVVVLFLTYSTIRQLMFYGAKHVPSSCSSSSVRFVFVERLCTAVRKQCDIIVVVWQGRSEAEGPRKLYRSRVYYIDLYAFCVRCMSHMKIRCTCLRVLKLLAFWCDKCTSCRQMRWRHSFPEQQEFCVLPLSRPT